jgi:asparagine synthase (glutamine-hydrolysing)
MCGIAGIAWCGRVDEPLTIRLDRMRDVMAARGPDDAHTVVFDELRGGLSARRLSIIDPDGGRQPIPSEDESVYAVLNGEIYNQRELREQLHAKGHRFRSLCDTEVLVHLYEELGLDFLGKLDGMFALAVFDRRKRRLVLARDGPGMKPLYYAPTPGGFLFASEIKALLASGMVAAEPDLEALNVSVGTALLPAPLSGFRGIKKLAPGCFVVSEAKNLQEGTFWRYRYRREGIPHSEAEQVEQLEQRLKGAVKSHVVADVKVGALVSGGWDSSLTATLASGYTASRLKTYSVVFPEDKQTDESCFSRELAAKIGSEHTEIEYRARDYIQSCGKIARAIEEPLSTCPAPVFWKLYGAASELKVVLSGEGSDELFAGYRELGQLTQHRLLRLVPSAPVNLLVSRVARPLPFPRAWRILAAPDSHAAEIEWRRAIWPGLKRRLLRPEYQTPGSDIDPLRLEPENLNDCRGLLERRLQFEFRRRLGDGMLVMEEKMAMAHGLELRMPFLDRSIVDFALALPADMKRRGRQEKYLLSLLARKLLPPNIAGRRKFGFRAKLDISVQNFVRERLLDDADPQPFDRRAIEQYLQAPASPDQRPKRHLNTLLATRCWWAEFFDKVATAR